MNTIKVTLIEKQTILRQTLEGLLSREEDIELSQSFPDLDDLNELARRAAAEIIIVNHCFGILDIVKKLKESNVPARVIILSEVSNIEDVIEAFDAGVMGYISMRSHIQDLLYGIRTVSKGLKFLSPTICEKLLSHIIAAEKCPTDNSLITHEEKRMLILAGNGFGNKEIALKMKTTVISVKHTLNKLFRKLEAKDRTQALIKSIHKGMISFRDLESGRQPTEVH